MAKTIHVGRFPSKTLRKAYEKLTREQLIDALLHESELRYIAQTRLCLVREAVNSDAPMSCGTVVERNGSLVKP